MPPTPETTASMDQRILNSSRRLTKMLSKKAPRVFIMQEIAMIVCRATLSYGPAVWEKIGESMASPVRDYYGACRECQSPVSERGLCEACKAAMAVLVAEFEAESTADDPRGDVA